MGRRKFGVTMLSTPKYYLFSEEEIKKIYYNLIKYIKYKYKNSNYDYFILVSISNVDGKSIDCKIKSNGVGRPKYTFIPKNKNKGVRYVNWHMHIMICGAPLGTMVKEIQDYLQKVLNNKLVKEEFDKRVLETPNFNRHYNSGYKTELDLILSGILKKRIVKKQRVPKCILTNLNVNKRTTGNSKLDYYNMLEYIEKQGMLTKIIKSEGFTVAYFDIAKKLNLLAKKGNKFAYKRNKNKALK